MKREETLFYLTEKVGFVVPKNKTLKNAIGVLVKIRKALL